MIDETILGCYQEKGENIQKIQRRRHSLIVRFFRVTMWGIKKSS